MDQKWSPLENSSQDLETSKSPLWIWSRNRVTFAIHHIKSIKNNNEWVKPAEPIFGKIDSNIGVWKQWLPQQLPLVIPLFFQLHL